ncbi:Uncharacterised protein [Klebsiella oxytoca]|jgi:hypothetical protein|nr:hypothetical protein L388_04062 [Klebsiella oxytoca MGH 42]KMV99672.1 hypothetical protein HMPREF9693_02208 [Klebsiella oxytoca 10-5249]CAF2184229.1 hypothetical protein AI2744V1_1110 [Klebsiella oxytoca]CAH5038139.1 hypothetical protein AI2744V1_1110 [Klebsiella oxytoca]CAH5709309.1 hypothetical protein AI3012V1_3069 [Klebsiella oxytoca]
MDIVIIQIDQPADFIVLLSFQQARLNMLTESVLARLLKSQIFIGFILMGIKVGRLGEQWIQYL